MGLVAWFKRNHLGKPSAGESADELLARDSRDPIVYLRSFDEERKRKNPIGALREAFAIRPIGGSGSDVEAEKMFTFCMNLVGPYIALSRHDERFYVFGAARKGVRANQWRQVIREWLSRAAYLVIHGGTTPGLGWEIKQVTSTFPPLRVLLITPGSRAEYARFRQWGSEYFQHPLPHKLPRSRLLIFDEGWSAEALKANQDIVATLSPFFRRNGLDYPPNALQAQLRLKRFGDALRSR